MININAMQPTNRSTAKVLLHRWRVRSFWQNQSRRFAADCTRYAAVMPYPSGKRPEIIVCRLS